MSAQNVISKQNLVQISFSITEMLAVSLFARVARTELVLDSGLLRSGRNIGMRNMPARHVIDTMTRQTVYISTDLRISP